MLERLLDWWDGDGRHWGVSISWIEMVVGGGDIFWNHLKFHANDLCLCLGKVRAQLISL